MKNCVRYDYERSTEREMATKRIAMILTFLTPLLCNNYSLQLERCGMQLWLRHCTCEIGNKFETIFSNIQHFVIYVRCMPTPLLPSAARYALDVN